MQIIAFSNALILKREDFYCLPGVSPSGLTWMYEHHKSDIKTIQ